MTTSPIPQVRVPESAERYDSLAACQARCDELNAAKAAARDAKAAGQREHGYCHDNGFTSWDYARFLPDVGGDYWRPRLVPGDR